MQQQVEQSEQLVGVRQVAQEFKLQPHPRQAKDDATKDIGRILPLTLSYLLIFGFSKLN